MTDWNNFYTGITPPPHQSLSVLMGRTPLDTIDRLPQGHAGIDPIGWTPPVGPAWNEPTSIDLAAIAKWNAERAGNAPGTATAYMPANVATPALNAATGLASPVTSVTGTMRPTRPQGGLLSLLFGPSKNGLGGLAGLLGGPGAGGLVGMLTQPRSQGAKPSTATDHKTARDAAERSGQTVSGSASTSGRYYNFDTNSWM